jgi:hypothetical protein
MFEVSESHIPSLLAVLSSTAREASTQTANNLVKTLLIGENTDDRSRVVRLEFALPDSQGLSRLALIRSVTPRVSALYVWWSAGTGFDLCQYIVGGNFALGSLR